MNVTIDGKVYDLDTNADVIRGLIESLISESANLRNRRYAGERYRESNSRDVYVLANVDNYKMCLVSLKDGNRWTNSVTTVGDGFANGDEWFTISRHGCFRKVDPGVQF